MLTDDELALVEELSQNASDAIRVCDEHVPRLLAEVRRLKAENADLRKRLEVCLTPSYATAYPDLKAEIEAKRAQVAAAEEEIDKLEEKCPHLWGTTLARFYTIENGHCEEVFAPQCDVCHKRAGAAVEVCLCRRCIEEKKVDAWWMILCPQCGNKRCPKAEYHGFRCERSNEPGQVGVLEDAYQ